MRTSHTTAKTTVASYVFEPGAEFPMHRHDEEQITVVIEGGIDFTVGGQTHHLGVGETFVVEPGVAHCLRAGDAGTRFVAVVVPRRTHQDAYELIP
jgi:quercetin dioxygenase-like cupin family protein